MNPDLEYVKKIQLINDLGYELLRWQDRAEIKDSQDAFRFVEEQIVYSLRMIWQGRFDKYSKAHCEIMDRLSLAYLPKDCNYTGAKRSELVMEDKDHTQLAKEVFAQLWAEYLSSDAHGLPRPPSPEQPVSLYKRFLALFK